MKKSLSLTSAAVGSFLWLAAVSVAGLPSSAQAAPAAPAAAHADAAHTSGWSTVKELVVVVHPTRGNSCSGTIRFTQMGDKVKVVADLTGLGANQVHAMHVHEFGDCTAPDGTSAGGHYNPEGHPHALPSTATRHAGDLGNVKADASGNAHYELEVDNISLVGMRNPIIGRSVIVHAQPDDGGQPVGNAGARIGCGVIGIAKPAA